MLWVLPFRSRRFRAMSAITGDSYPPPSPVSHHSTPLAPHVTPFHPRLVISLTPSHPTDFPGLQAPLAVPSLPVVRLCLSDLGDFARGFQLPILAISYPL